MDVDEITTTSELEALVPEWERLYESLPAATPFQSPAWLLPWWRHVFAGGRLWALALRRGGRLAGFAPFFVYGIGERIVAALGAGISDYPDVLAEPEGGGAILEHLRRRASEWDLCNFQDLRPCSPLLAAGVTNAEPYSTCVVVPLPARLPAGIRRARRRFERIGARFEAAEPQSMDEFLEALFRLHTARWESRGRPGMLASAHLRAFHCEAASELGRRGMLRLYGLRAGGRLLAVLYGFAALGRFYAYLSGFDPAVERLSPGAALLAMAIERAAEEGLREFDLLRRREPYKYQWGAEERVNRRLLMYARSAA